MPRCWVGWVISGTDMMAEAGTNPPALPLLVEQDAVVATLSPCPGPWLLGVTTVDDTGPGTGGGTIHNSLERLVAAATLRQTAG